MNGVAKWARRAECQNKDESRKKGSWPKEVRKDFEEVGFGMRKKTFEKKESNSVFSTSEFLYKILHYSTLIDHRVSIIPENKIK